MISEKSLQGRIDSPISTGRMNTTLPFFPDGPVMLL